VVQNELEHLRQGLRVGLRAYVEAVLQLYKHCFKSRFGVVAPIDLRVALVVVRTDRLLVTQLNQTHKQSLFVLPT